MKEKKYKRKSETALRTIGEVSEEMNLPTHVLRFWESKFSEIKPQKRRGGHRYYRPQDVEVLREIKHLLYEKGLTIKGAQKHFKEQRSIERQTPSGQMQTNINHQSILPSAQKDESITSDTQHIKHLLSELTEIKKLLSDTQ